MNTLAEKCAITIRWPEVPKGMDLAEKTIATTCRALRDTYPLFNDPTYSIRLPKPDDIRFKPFKTVQDAERIEIPKGENVLSDGYESHVSEKDPIYWNPDTTRVMYISDDAFSNHLSSDDPVERSKYALTLSVLITLKTFEFLSVSNVFDSPQNRSTWKEIIRGTLYSRFEKIKDEARKKDMKNLNEYEKVESYLIRKNVPLFSNEYDRAKQAIESYLIDSKEFQFIAHGAKVVVVLPHQTTRYPSYKIGDVLNEGIVEILAEPVHQKAFKDMKNTHLISDVQLNHSQTKSRTQAINILPSLNEHLSPPNNNSLLKAFADSLIPIHLQYSKAIESSPNTWSYPD